MRSWTNISRRIGCCSSARHPITMRLVPSERCGRLHHAIGIGAAGRGCRRDAGGVAVHSRDETQEGRPGGWPREGWGMAIGQRSPRSARGAQALGRCALSAGLGAGLERPDRATERCRRPTLTFLADRAAAAIEARLCRRARPSRFWTRSRRRLRPWLTPRSSVLPPAGARIILRDGDPGEPEQALEGFSNSTLGLSAPVGRQPPKDANVILRKKELPQRMRWETWLIQLRPDFRLRTSPRSARTARR
jgi:hypothetical protein